MTTTDVAGLGHGLIEAFNAQDWDRLRHVVADDLVYEETGTGRHLEGAVAYLALCAGWKATFPDLNGAVERTLQEGDWAALRVDWTGTQSGPLEGPTGTIPATGRTGTTRATLWMRAKDGRVAHIDHHLDVMGLLANLGAVPA